MVDLFGTLLFVASGQALSWAFLPRFSWPVKAGAGLLASLTLPALFSTALNLVGVPFSALTVYAVFLVLLGIGAWRLWQDRDRKK